jgi:hypothetical protein
MQSQTKAVTLLWWTTMAHPGLLRRWLKEPRLKDINLNGDERLEIHKEILLEKPMLKEVFSEFYRLCYTLDNRYFTGIGKRIEIGAGVSFFKDCYPEVISSDLMEASHLDMIIDAQQMNLSDHSIRSIYGINCFHHFSEPDLFLNELERVLTPGGGCILIEPYYGLLAKEFFKRVFASEHFNNRQKSWCSTYNNISVMTGANQALSYIVFVRDRKEFQSKHPHLDIIINRPLNNYVRYLTSGGLNFKSILPPAFAPFLKFLEFLLIPFRQIMALHYVIVIKKK